MFGAQSEYLPLRRVIMHRPSEEVHRVTASAAHEFLYRESSSKEKMQEEHDSYVHFLEDEHVDVINVEGTLCPNLIFTRDTASITRKGALLMRPKHAARFFEPSYLEETFQSLNIPTMKITRGCAEGGDLVYLNEDTLMVGFGPRTDFDGLSQIKESLLEEAVKEIIAVPLPSFRVHLDGALMIITHDLAVLHPESLIFPAKFLKKNELVSLPMFLQEEGFDLIEVTDQEVKAFGPNLLVVRPDLVVSYSWNTRIISELEERSIEVIKLEGHELVKAAGGPHCMTCPVLRSNLM